MKIVKSRRDKLSLQIKAEFGVVTHVVELVVESARVADRLAAAVAPPQRGSGGPAVGADGALSARRVLRLGWTEMLKMIHLL